MKLNRKNLRKMILKEMAGMGVSDFGGDPSVDAYSKLVSHPEQPLKKIMGILIQSRQHPELIRAYENAMNNFYENGAFDPQGAAQMLKPVLVHIGKNIASQVPELRIIVQKVGADLDQI